MVVAEKILRVHCCLENFLLVSESNTSLSFSQNKRLIFRIMFGVAAEYGGFNKRPQGKSLAIENDSKKRLHEAAGVVAWHKERLA